jgi:hypothetical protein
LKHFSFEISSWLDLNGSFMENYVPLFEIFPVYAWYNLRHLSLMGLHVEIDDLVLFLTSHSPIIRRVELHDFHIRSRNLECRWEIALRRIKEECPQMGKKLTIGIGLWPPGRRVWIRDRIQLYFDGGASPFEKEKDGTAVDKSTLGVVKNDFDEKL